MPSPSELSLSRHDASPAGYAATPWPAEDGGPERLQQARHSRGPNASGLAIGAVRQALLSVMVVLPADDDGLLLLRARPFEEGASWVELVDPESLEVRRRSEDLALGSFWPGGVAVLDDGSALVVQGRWAHRLAPDLSVERSRELPVDAPYNSFVLLGDGTVATKDLERPGSRPSTLSLLDPRTLEDRAPPVDLGEPSVARLSARGNELTVVGVTGLARARWDPSAARLEPAPPGPARYLVHPEQSFGWDAVVGPRWTWWMDNGAHTYEQRLTMLGAGVARGPLRLWRADGEGSLASVEVSGLPAGAVTNPPLVDEGRGVVVAYDSANAVMAAFGTEELEPRWRIDLATAQHLILYPDTGELLANDHDPQSGDAAVLLDVADGSVRARVPVESPAQSVVFGAPGRRRDAFYVSLSTVARLVFT